MRSPATLLRAAISVLVVALVALPAITANDSFPLSTYPMYASARAEVATFNTAIVVRPDGTWDRLSIEHIADTDDPLVAQSLLAQELQHDGGATLCREILDRVDAASQIDFADQIELVADRVDVRTGDLLERTTHRQCAP